MKKSEANSLKAGFSIFAVVSLMAFGNSASAETLDSVSHIHHVKAVENKVLVLTHEGLYELVGKNDMRLVGKEKTDVMGFTTLGKEWLASGHPAEGSTMPNPIGLIKSIDGGLNWKTISLVGKVDFHFLEGARTDLYGADSQSTELLYSSNSGKTWRSLGANTFADIAVSPEKSATAIALKDSELLLTKNAFKTSSKIKSSLKFTQVEWSKSGLFALSGSSLYKSTNSGKTWTKQSTFKGVPGILSASDHLILVTVGSEIFTAKNDGKKFKVFY
jgi:photosystem II stability/assembly factor-like uncharacterized protein